MGYFDLGGDFKVDLSTETFSFKLGVLEPYRFFLHFELWWSLSDCWFLNEELFDFFDFNDDIDPFEPD